MVRQVEDGLGRYVGVDEVPGTVDVSAAHLRFRRYQQTAAGREQEVPIG